MNEKAKGVLTQRCPTCDGKTLNPVVSWPISSHNRKGTGRATPMWTSFTIRGLLFSWLCFGGLELLEQLNFIPAVEDLDEVALLQAASGLKSVVSSHDTIYPDHTYVAGTVAEPAVSLSVHTICQVSRLIRQAHGPLSLRLRQYHSVYRI
jgi:hypothetical protein